MRGLARSRAPASAREPHAERGRGRTGPAGRHPAVARRPLHRKRRRGGAGAGGPGHRRGGAAPGCSRGYALRRARDRDRGRPRGRRGDGAGPHRLPFGPAGWGRLVRPLLQEPGLAPAAAQGARLGDAHGPDRRRAGGLGDGARLRLSQARRWRLHRLSAQRHHRRHRSGQLPLSRRLPADAQGGMAGPAAQPRPALRRGGASAAALGARPAFALRGGVDRGGGAFPRRARRSPRAISRGPIPPSAA